VQGLGAGLPLISFLTLILSYRRLTVESLTPWDERLGIEVAHSEWGPVRWVAAVLVVLLMAGFYFYDRLRAW